MTDIIHKTRAIKVWVDVDEPIADFVLLLNEIPGIRTPGYNHSKGQHEQARPRTAHENHAAHGRRCHRGHHARAKAEGAAVTESPTVDIRPAPLTQHEIVLIRAGACDRDVPEVIAICDVALGRAPDSRDLDVLEPGAAESIKRLSKRDAIHLLARDRGAR